MHSLLLGLVEQVSVFEGVPLTFAQGRFNTSEERGVSNDLHADINHNNQTLGMGE